MIDVKLSSEELCLFEVFRHPVWCSEFLRNLDRPENDPWILAPYQVEMLCDHNTYVVLCCGRAIGKSEEILDKVTWYMVNNFFDQDPIAIVTPNRVHLEPLFSKLRRWLAQHSFLKHFVGRHNINSSIFNIHAKNGFQLDCRIAGTSGGGSNVIGLHTPVILLDEAGIFPWGTWIELLPTFNTWTEGAQLFVSGVPTGQRDHNVLYFCDVEDPSYNSFNIPQHDNPRYTEVDEVRNKKQFGGVESEEYVHLVLGRHGSPVYALFDRDKMYIQPYDIFVSKIYGNKVRENPLLLGDLMRILPMPPNNISQMAFGIDLGYSEPTVILGMYKIQNRWKFLFRLIFTQVNYPTQQEFIAKLSKRYDPAFIGIDSGGAGKPVVQNLIHDSRYKNYHLDQKVIAVDFNKNVFVGYDHEGEELKERAKVYGMQRLQEFVNTHNITFSKHDDDMIIELERTVYSRGPSGRLIYRTMTARGGKSGDDHNVAALLSFMLAHFYKYEQDGFSMNKKRLWSSRWL